MDSAHLKIKRAEKHLAELSLMFRSKQPFGYYLEINLNTGIKATFAKRNKEVANEAAIIIGDIIHNLRSAIDHAYWNCTEKHAKSDGERRNIQFTIPSTEKALIDSVLTGLPSRVSNDFSAAIQSLRPFRDGGDRLLCAIHDLDVLDKHKLLVPTGNFTKINSLMLQKQIPDFPSGITNGGFGNNTRDVAWQAPSMTWTQIRKLKPPPSNIIEKKLDVQVDIVLNDIDPKKPALDSLQELIITTKNTIKVLYLGAGIHAD